MKNRPGLQIYGGSITNCGAGVVSDVPVMIDGLSIKDTGVGVALTKAAAARSTLRNLSFDSVEIAVKTGKLARVIPQMSYLDAMPEAEKIQGIYELAHAHPHEAHNVAREGKIAQYLRQQGIGDWLTLVDTIKEAIQNFPTWI